MDMPKRWGWRCTPCSERPPGAGSVVIHTYDRLGSAGVGAILCSCSATPVAGLRCARVPVRGRPASGAYRRTAEFPIPTVSVGVLRSGERTPSGRSRWSRAVMSATETGRRRRRETSVNRSSRSKKKFATRSCSAHEPESAHARGQRLLGLGSPVRVADALHHRAKPSSSARRSTWSRAFSLGSCPKAVWSGVSQDSARWPGLRRSRVPSSSRGRDHCRELITRYFIRRVRPGQDRRELRQLNPFSARIWTRRDWANRRTDKASTRSTMRSLYWRPKRPMMAMARHVPGCRQRRLIATGESIGAELVTRPDSS